MPSGSGLVPLLRGVDRKSCLAPGLEAAVNIGCNGEAQLLQRRGGQALILLAPVAQQNDVIAKPWS